MKEFSHSDSRGAGRYWQSFVGVVAGMIVFAAPVSHTQAAEQHRDYLYEKFQDGDIPTGQDFATLIDSLLHSIDDRFSLSGIATGPDAGAAFFGPGAIVDQSLYFGQAAGLSNSWAGHSGFMPLSFMQNSELHYGYFQLSSGQPDASALYPMQIHYFVYEDQANTPLVTAAVPEPSTFVLLAIGIVGLFLCCLQQQRFLFTAPRG